ncbi:MAG: RNA polymerase sigma factor [Actinomycetota bacterium]
MRSRGDGAGGPPPGRLDADVAAARGGDRAALERVIVEIHPRVHRLALRMTACPADAEDATQEILIRVITRLDSFRGQAAFTTWVHRVAANHLLDCRRSRAERLNLTFDGFAADLLDGLDAGPSARPDAALLEREVQLACTHALLTCLDREHRLAYVLGEVFELDSAEAGGICGVDPATYRKRLSRARQRVRGFLSAHCGLVAERAACHCSRRVEAAVRSGRVDPDRLRFTERVEDVTTGVAGLCDAAGLLRSLPPARVPAGSRERVLALIERTGLLT